jgi:hypothetical protein
MKLYDEEIIASSLKTLSPINILFTLTNLKIGPSHGRRIIGNKCRVNTPTLVVADY